MTSHILLAQINPIVGDISHNTQKIIDIIRERRQQHQIIIFPELSLCGYPPEDLLLQSDFIQAMQDALTLIQQECAESTVILGLARQDHIHLYNSAAIINKHHIHYTDKQCLPNYGVFDECRYFSPGQTKAAIFELQGLRYAVLICEDIWIESTLKNLSHDTVDVLISINASPYERDKVQRRMDILKRNQAYAWHQIYVNQVGGQDELLFDGQSLAMDAQGVIQAQAQAFKEELLSITVSKTSIEGKKSHPLSKNEELYQGLCLGLRDFSQKNGFKNLVLGLSGGIDSALALAIAVDALGPNAVHALLMPSEYTDEISIIDAELEAKALNISYDIIPITPLFASAKDTLTPVFTPNSLCQQNLQARIRGMLLMAYANQHQALVLSTSNKSETAVGYCTLYGDMCGGFSILKDVYKTDVYALAEYRNQRSEVIPKRVIERPPSAELMHDQKDEDDLPAYVILDDLLVHIIEKRASLKDLLQLGYPQELVLNILKRIKSSEFKRAQAAPGLKISSVNFGKDWRYPITNLFEHKIKK